MKILTHQLTESGAVTAYLQEPSPELAANAVRPAVLILPGGAYQFCSDREAEPVALAYLAEGFNAFVLRYAVGPDSPWEQSFADAQAAVLWLHTNASDLSINPDWIAAVGFSAGGHLASSLGVAAEVRPNALVLGYPVTRKEFGPPVGKAILDIPTSVDSATPATFLFSTQSDTLVPIAESLSLLVALAENGVPFESHIYLLGGHGLSLSTAATANGSAAQVDEAVGEWFKASVRFLNRVFGPFPLAGAKPAYGDFLESRRPGIHMPLGRLAGYPAAVDVLAELSPEILGRLESNPMFAGTSLAALAEYSSDALSGEKLEALKTALGIAEQDMVAQH